jgi:hypothetical protein
MSEALLIKINADILNAAEASDPIVEMPADCRSDCTPESREMESVF